MKGSLMSSNESEVLLSPIPNKAIPNKIAPIVVPKNLHLLPESVVPVDGLPFYS
jgi:hypothetical protein